MKRVTITLGAVTLAVVLLAGGAWLGIAGAQDRWGHQMEGYGMGPAPALGSGGASDWIDMHNEESWQGYGMMGDVPYSESWQGYGMMGDLPYNEGWQGHGMAAGESFCGGAYYLDSEGGEVTTLHEAQEAVEAYVDRLGYEGLHVTEVMEFELNYYAIVAEEESGIGAMELLIDKGSSAVRPEPGPNMMWNAEYGMHGGGGMMGGFATGEMTLSPEEARDVAQDWLDTNYPGRTAGEPDPFYGYYTLHFMNDGIIDGMLSVHGSSGQVWYHSWHGDFIDMTEGHD